MKLWLLRLAIHAAYHPSRWFNQLMCLLGVWRHADWIDEHVLVGAVPSRQNLRLYASQGVRAVVNMCEEFAGHQKTLDDLGLMQLHLPTLDYHCPSVADLRGGIAFIQETIASDGRVFIHCKAGRGRSAIMAICYLMATRHCSAAEAELIVRRARGHIARRVLQHDAVRVIEAECATKAAAGD